MCTAFGHNVGELGAGCTKGNDEDKVKEEGALVGLQRGVPRADPGCAWI